MSWSKKTHLISHALIKEMQLPTDFIRIVDSIYLPLTQHILDQKTDKPLFISINGAQGTGKSTLSHFLKYLIEAETDYSVANISLDDFYSTRIEREKLAILHHPLLVTRGVPGTHDIQLMENTISKLLHGKKCLIPRFNKAMDDRYSKDQWTSCNENTDIVLFEGWCNHSPVQDEKDLIIPVNQLEATEDAEGIWRHFSNEQLKIYHKKIFNHADMSIILKAPDFEKIYQWRSLQEDKLRKNSKPGEESRIMDQNQLNRFIQHYERITRHTLQNLPLTADVVIPIEADHSINSIIKRHGT